MDYSSMVPQEATPSIDRQQATPSINPGNSALGLQPQPGMLVIINKLYK